MALRAARLRRAWLGCQRGGRGRGRRQGPEPLTPHRVPHHPAQTSLAESQAEVAAAEGAKAKLQERVDALAAKVGRGRPLALNPKT